MAAQKRGLGRGLDALLGEYTEPAPQGVTEVDVYSIDNNPDQPRKDFDRAKLEELAESIRRHGVVQPIVVKQNGSRYRIIAGERRFRAARLAGLATVPVIVRELEEREIMEVALVENLQRENLNPIEEAAAVRLLMTAHDLTQEEVASRIGRSRPAVANSLRLLALPASVQSLVKDGSLQAGHARALAGVKDEKRLVSLAKQAVDEGWSVRQTEAACREPEKKVKKAAPVRDPYLYDAETRFREKLGLRVALTGSHKKGKLVIAYSSADDLQRLYDTILGD